MNNHMSTEHHHISEHGILKSSLHSNRSSMHPSASVTFRMPQQLTATQQAWCLPAGWLAMTYFVTHLTTHLSTHKQVYCAGKAKQQQSKHVAVSYLGYTNILGFGALMPYIAYSLSSTEFTQCFHIHPHQLHLHERTLHHSTPDGHIIRQRIKVTL